MEPDCLAVARRRRAPLAHTEHLGLVPLLDWLSAAAAHHARGLGAVLVPLDPVMLMPAPQQVVHVAAQWAWQEVASLIARQVFPLDPGESLEGRRAGKQHLAAGEGRGAFLSQCHGVALAIDVAR